MRAADEAPHDPASGIDTRPYLRSGLVDGIHWRNRGASVPLVILIERPSAPSLERLAEDLSPIARDLAAQLRQSWNIDFDDAGAIGRRYRRQDEIGTPFCITVDFDSLEDKAVTVRHRDTMAQERIPMADLSAFLATALIGS
jgi:histidyl-tRNA synthetase